MDTFKAPVSAASSSHGATPQRLRTTIKQWKYDLQRRFFFYHFGSGAYCFISEMLKNTNTQQMQMVYGV